MEGQWIFRNKNWFAGFAPFVPKTNNALESFNNVIKKSIYFTAKTFISSTLRKCVVVLHD